MKQYLLYLARWQCSSPILALCMWLLPFNMIVKTIIANLIGGLVFYWVDRLIFKEAQNGNKQNTKA